ncbi:YadA-like family protein [Neisseria sp. 23W00296]|uniref:YadA-like family protein n=2 Tax=unclassified Neisseria TaxID=2623750 RepID=UPI00383B02F8
MTVANDGKVTPPAAADAGKLATAGDIANAINNSGFQATAGGRLASGTTATATTVKPGQKVTFAAGNGLTVKQDVDATNGDQTYTYALDAQTVVQNAQTPVVYTDANGNKVYKHTDGNFYDAPNGAGNQVATGDVIASMQNAAGNTTAPTTLANVKGNLADTSNATGNPNGNDRATLAAGNKGNNAATVNDVLNAGFTVQGNGVAKDFVTHGDTVNFANGQGTVAKVESKDGVTKVSFDTPMQYVDNSGKASTDPTNTVSLVGKDSGKPVQLKNVAKGVADTDAVNVSQLKGAASALGGGSSIDKDGNFTAPSYTLVDGKPSDGKTKAYNNVGDALSALNTAATSPLTFAGDSGTNVERKLGSTVNVKGGVTDASKLSDNNIGVVANGTDGLNVKLAKELKGLTSAEFANAAGDVTAIGGNGVTITPKAAGKKPVSLTSNGLNNGGNTVTGVGSALNLYPATAPKTAGLLDLSNLSADQKASAATAGDLANMGWVVSSDKTTGNESQAFSGQVKNAGEVEFVGTGAAKVTAKTENGKHTVTVGVDSASIADSIAQPVVYTKTDGSKAYKRGNKFYDAQTGGNEIKPADVIASMNNAAGSTTAPMTLANVKDNLKDAANGKAVSTPTDGARSDLTKDGKGNNAATVNDVLNAGFTVQGNGVAKDFVTHGDTVNFANGQGTVAKVESKDGVTKVSFDTPMQYVDNSGKASTDPTNTVSLVGKDSGKPVQLKNVAKGVADTDAVNVSQLKGAASALGGGSSIDKDGNFTAPSYTLVDGKPSDGKTKAYNNVGDALSALNTAATSPLTFAGDSGTNVERKLGSTVNVKGGVTDASKLSDNNIGVVANGTDGLNVKLAKELKGLTSAEFANAAGDVTAIGGNGVTITPKAAGKKPVSLTSNGLNNGGNTVTGVGSALNLYPATAPKTAGLLDLSNLSADQKASAATAGDLANMGWVVSSDKTTGNESQAFSGQVKNAGEVEFVGTGAAKVTAKTENGKHTVTVGVDSASIADSIAQPVVYTKTDGSKAYKRGNKFYDAQTGGNEIKPADVIASMNNAAGSTTAPMTLANVKDNLKDAANGKAVSTPTDGARSDLTKDGKGNNAATVNDVLNAGFTVQGNGVAKDFVTHGDTVNFANGQGTVAKVESKDGVTKVSFDTPMQYVDNSGKASTDPTNTVSLVGKDSGKPVQLKNVAKGVADTDAVNVSQLKGAASALGGGSSIDKDGNFTAPSYTLVDGKPSDGKTKAYNNVGDALSALNTAATSPLTFAGDSGTNVERKLGSTVNVKGGVTDASKLSDNNIGVVANGTDGLNVKLAKELKGLTSAEFANAAGDVTAIGGNGVTITPKAAGKKPVSLTSNGLNNGGNRITNVAPGTADTDAVNVSQLNQAAAKAANKVEAGSNIVVTPTQNKDGSTTYKVATANDLKANSFTAGGVSLSAKGINAGNKAITNVAAGVNNTDAANVGQVKAAKTEVKAGTNIASVVETKGSNGQSIYTVNADGASVSAGSTALTVTKGKKNANNVTDYAVDLSAKTKADIAKGAVAKDALDTKGLTFTGDTGTTGVKKLGSQVAVTGDSNITTKADASGVNVALKRDLNVDSVTAGNTTVNNGGVTIKSPTTGNPNNTVNLTANGLSNGGKQITNVASGLNGRTVAQIKAEGSKAAEWNNAATVGDLTQVENNVTNISNNYSKTLGGDNNQYVDNTGKLTPAGKVALKTYNVSGQKEYVNNSVISAIKNMNEQGIKFFHVNDGQTQIDQATNTEDSSAAGKYAVAIGYQAKGNGVDAVAMGSQSVASGQNGIAIGKGAQATGANSISIGTGNKVSGANSGAFGDPSIINGANSYSVGNNNTVATDNTFVLGNNVTATKANSAFLGNNSGSFSQTGATTDATTGVHKAVSGSSNYTYLGANDANVAGVSDTVGIVSVGNASETRQIQGVAAGVISATSTDAINGSQLYYTNQAINQNINNQVVNMGNQLNQKIDDVAADSKAGTAAAMAVAGLPQAYLPGKSMMAVGGSVYRGESGYAIGYSSISDGGNWIIKGTVTGNSRGHVGGTAAVGYQW